jgi:hypothetical protein
MKNIFHLLVIMVFAFTIADKSLAQLSTSSVSFDLDTRSGPTWSGNGIGDYATGVFVKTGDSIHITASGSFYNGVKTVPSPDGWPSPPDPGYGQTIMPNLASNALVGGIGISNDQYFITPLDGGDTGAHGPGFVGSNFIGVAKDPGQIYLAINDTPLSDNVDDLVVNILVLPLTNVETGNVSAPAQFMLLQNFPNPFNPGTTIQYSIATRNYVTLKVYDMLGREVIELVNESKEAGNYGVHFDASKLVSGLYVYTLRSGSYSITKKMILIK